MKTVYNRAIISGFAALCLSTPSSATESTHQGACNNTTHLLRTSCYFETYKEFFEGRALCKNISNRETRRSCYEENKTQKSDTHQECLAVAQARDELCADIGEDRYDPPFGPDFADNFVDPLEIGGSVTPNAYSPLVAGSEWIYKGTSINEEGEEETETIVVKVTDKTKLIDGINCIVVNDLVTEGDDDEVIEDTDDWYAQDKEGNVWYCGEIAKNFEFFEGDEPQAAELTDIEGSWKAGRDGAKAGILIPAKPEVGDVIRQEVAWGEAEDVIEILSVTGSESTPAASCLNDCLVTKDFSPLDPGVEENKYYAPGIGTILEIDLETGDRLELVEFNQP